MKRKIIGQILRHGKTYDNLLHVMSGYRNPALLPEGINQLKQLRNHLNLMDTDLNYTTDLDRAIDTFKIYFPNTPIDKILPEFREFNFGRFEGQNIDQVADLTYHYFLNNIDDNLQWVETYNQCLNRYQQGFNKIIDDLRQTNSSSFTLMAHNGTMRMFKNMLFGFDKETFRQFKTENGKGIIITFDLDDHSISNFTLEIIQ